MTIPTKDPEPPFTTVSYRRSKPIGRRNGTTSSKSKLSLAAVGGVGFVYSKKNSQILRPIPESSLAPRLEQIEAKKKLLTATEIYSDRLVESLQVLQTWVPAADRILALGLGRISTSRAGQIQLALLLHLRDRWFPKASVQIYDPVLEELDFSVLQHYGIEVIENRDGKYPITSKTIVYMPHCDRFLYENLIQTNWNPQAFQQIVLIANVLERYASNRGIEEEAPCLFRLLNNLETVAIPNLAAPHSNGLNDLAIQRWNQQCTIHTTVERQGRKKNRKPPIGRMVETVLVDESQFFTLPTQKESFGSEEKGQLQLQDHQLIV